MKQSTINALMIGVATTVLGVWLSKQKFVTDLIG